jgi:hypothetical protein
VFTVERVPKMMQHFSNIFGFGGDAASSEDENNGGGPPLSRSTAQPIDLEQKLDSPHDRISDHSTNGEETMFVTRDLMRDIRNGLAECIEPYCCIFQVVGENISFQDLDINITEGTPKDKYVTFNHEMLLAFLANADFEMEAVQN